ncbi:MAG: signal peptidase I [Oscillospiraceae bacterium]
MKVVLNIFRVLSWICYLIIVLFILIELPLIFGYKPEIVLTGSMIPTYPIDSIIYYKQTDFKDIHINDVITFDLGQSIVTHRVVDKDIQNMSFVTKGDANASNDRDVVYYNQVQGKVGTVCIKHLGKFVIIFQSNRLIIIVMATILIIYYILSHIADSPKFAKKDCSSNLE